MAERAHLWISGRVQGVFFRANTQDKAKALKLRGFVRNLRDGRVEVVVEGDKERIGELIEWCYHGSGFASVSNVQVEWENPTQEFTDFEISY